MLYLIIYFDDSDKNYFDGSFKLRIRMLSRIIASFTGSNFEKDAAFRFIPLDLDFPCKIRLHLVNSG
jgi:hypothetical protein